MGYVSVAKGKGFIVSASKDLWVFGAIAIPLVVLTMGVYLAYEVSRECFSLRKISIAESAEQRIIDIA